MFVGGGTGPTRRALGVAARSLARATGLEPATRRSLTGVDYLALSPNGIDVTCSLGCGWADPGNAGMAHPWDLAVIVTAGRLLISAMA